MNVIKTEMCRLAPREVWFVFFSFNDIRVVGGGLEAVDVCR